MAPATITEVSFIEKPTRIEESLNYKLQEHVINNNFKGANKTSPYEQTRPKNELKFLATIREWEKAMGFETAVQWINVILIFSLHVGFLWFFYRAYYGIGAKWQSLTFAFFTSWAAALGVTAGAHRYWCHRSYKAKLPLQIILALCFSIAGQNSIYEWVRDHRVHHKFTETSADPHNVQRGFFFSHCGWLMMKKHPAVMREGAKCDMSDLAKDPVVQFQKKYFGIINLLCCFVLPTVITVMLFDETWANAILTQPLLRYACVLNATWFVNSFAHMFGNKPYDKDIKASENLFVSFCAFGEGFHNYHHTFPWDYKTAELPFTLNVTTIVLDIFAKIGWAYDLKVASPTLIQAVIRNQVEKH